MYFCRRRKGRGGNDGGEGSGECGGGVFGYIK